MFRINDKNYELHNGMYYQQISELKQGLAFGELALLSEDSKRNATVKCITGTIFATLDRRNFDRSLKKIEARHTNKIITFLTSIPCFIGMKKGIVQKFIYFMTKERFIRNQVVYEQGQPVNAVYIVIKGDFESHRRLPPLEDQS